MTDLIIKGAGGIKDGLYVIKDGEFFKYKPNGGSVRSYHVTDRPRGEWIDKEELIDAINDAQFVYDGNEGEHKEHDITELVRVIFKDIIDNLSTTTKGEA